MTLFNLMEDIVANITDNILKNNRVIDYTESNRADIIAYILNRIPPRYITSERGILHGKIEYRHLIQEKADIIILANEAIDVIVSRRALNNSHVRFSPRINKEENIIPHIMGEVLEESTFSVIPGVEVSLLIDGEKAAMNDKSWGNPYSTNRSTRGYYHFWPSQNYGDPLKPVYRFELLFCHPDFIDKKMEISVEPVAAKGSGISFLTPIALMRARKGVDISFLYD